MSNHTELDISTIIKGLISEWKIEPYSINCGLCEDFAMTVINRMGGYSDDLYELCTENFSEIIGLSSHVWIFYKGKHFDAEVPKGVDDFLDLPIFKHCR